MSTFRRGTEDRLVNQEAAQCSVSLRSPKNLISARHYHKPLAFDWCGYTAPQFRSISGREGPSMAPVCVLGSFGCVACVCHLTRSDLEPTSFCFPGSRNHHNFRMNLRFLKVCAPQIGAGSRLACRTGPLPTVAEGPACLSFALARPRRSCCGALRHVQPIGLTRGHWSHSSLYCNQAVAMASGEVSFMHQSL